MKYEEKLTKKERRQIERQLPAHKDEKVVSWEEALAACEYNESALDIISESEYTTHNRVGIHRHLRAANIINDFLVSDTNLSGKRILELGPGHYSFAMIAKALGSEVVCVEKYTPHVRLGKALGFEVLEQDFEDLTSSTFSDKFDGLWIKGCFNACRFSSDEEVFGFVDTLTSLLNPQAWGWCIPRNKSSGKEADDAETQRGVDVQRKAFEAAGWDVEEIAESDRKRYGLTFSGCDYYFTRNLGR
jgi:hypothetical protein